MASSLKTVRFLRDGTPKRSRERGNAYRTLGGGGGGGVGGGGGSDSASGGGGVIGGVGVYVNWNARRLRAVGVAAALLDASTSPTLLTSVRVASFATLWESLLSDRLTSRDMAAIAGR
jgi:hypothetical protein